MMELPEVTVTATRLRRPPPPLAAVLVGLAVAWALLRALR